MIKVLQITKGALMGGGEQHVLTLLEGLKDQEDVRVDLAVFTEGKLADAAQKLGIKVHVFIKRYRGDFQPLKQLISLMKTQKIDIVHTHLISGNFYGRLAAKIAGVKGIISTLHHSKKGAVGYFPVPFMQELFFHGDNLMARVSDRVITPSEDLKQLIVNYGINPGKIVTIPNAVNMKKTLISEEEIDCCRKELAVKPDSKIVGMVGRLVPVKNFELFIHAAGKVIDRGVNVQFLIVGDGPLRNDLQKLVTDLKMDGSFIFTGFREDVFRLVAMMDLFVLCSKSETNPIALMEAMALGKPVIATDVGGVAEVVDHEMDGWLCPSDDKDHLADAMIYLLNSPEKAFGLGKNAREKILTRYSLERISNQLMDVYREMARTG